MKSPLPKSSRPDRDEREYGLVVGGIATLFGAVWTYRGRFGWVAFAVLAVGALLLVLAAGKPSWLRLPRRLWMRLAEGLGAIMTLVILALVFFLVITPIGRVKRLMGWDPMSRRAPRGTSYWRPFPARIANPRHFEKMF